MLTLLSVYSESARQDFLLPTAENVTLCARAERFGLGRDIALTLSAAGGWHFTGPCTASLRHAGVPTRINLQEGTASLTAFLGGSHLCCWCASRRRPLPPMTVTACAGQHLHRQRGGLRAAVHLSSGGQQYITQYHAELRFDGTSFGIYDRSRNGVLCQWPPCARVGGAIFGDEVDIWGLSLVILNGGLAVRRTPAWPYSPGVLTPGPAQCRWAQLCPKPSATVPRSLAPLAAEPITPEAAPAGDAGFLSAILPGRRAEQQTAHTAWLARVAAQLQDRCDANTRVMHAQYPSAAHCCCKTRWPGGICGSATPPRQTFDLPRRAGDVPSRGRTGPARRRPRRAILNCRKIRCAA